ncbi:hypothetical protein GLW08_01935 [Pontibacillus yanchengensis]|uniref:Uncharacterized protein n=1 Tax=Pontibacillus yanchengensis TaxID=462910 RepID=A0ACC7VBI2_9BACI|nr:hypothetical protein [Pontibacillus yanchengensis]
MGSPTTTDDVSVKPNERKDGPGNGEIPWKNGGVETQQGMIFAQGDEWFHGKFD